MRSTLATMRSVRNPLVGKCRSASRDQPVTIASKMSSMSGPEEDLAAGQVHPVDVRILADEREHFVGRQLVGRLPLPDVARLAPVLAPVGEAEIELQRRGGSPEGRLREGATERAGTPKSFGNRGCHLWFRFLHVCNFTICQSVRSVGLAMKKSAMVSLISGTPPTAGYIRLLDCRPERGPSLLCRRVE